MPYAQQQEAFHRDGFAVVRRLLPAAEFDELAAELDRYIHQVVPTLPESDAFYHDRRRPETLKQLQHMDRDPYFDAYRHHPRWLELASALLEEPVVSLGPEWFNKPPGLDHVTPPHQDNYYFNLEPPQVLTIWMALDRIDEDNGCLRYLPGSHRHGVVHHGATGTLGFSQGIPAYGEGERSREVPVCLDPGDVTVHHGNTIHRADANRCATRHRRAFAMVVRAASCRRDEAGFARYQAALQAQHATLGLGPQA